MGSPLNGSVTGLLYVAIGIVLGKDPDSPEVLGFEQAARIADRLGTAMAAPPARLRNCRRFMGWRAMVCASSRQHLISRSTSMKLGYHSRAGRARDASGGRTPDPKRVARAWSRTTDAAIEDHGVRLGGV